jgi:hypothetical protein
LNLNQHFNWKRVRQREGKEKGERERERVKEKQGKERRELLGSTKKLCNGTTLQNVTGVDNVYLYQR